MKSDYMKNVQQFLRKSRPFLWVIGIACVIVAIVCAAQANWQWATNWGLLAGLAVSVPSLLSANVQPVDKPLPSTDVIVEYQRKHPTATTAEAINDIRSQ